MSTLFSPLQIKSIQLKNRIVVSPMCQYSSQDGFANDWHLVHLGSRAVGGAGLIILEATGVSPEARITPDDLGIWKDDHVPGLKRIVSFLEANGSVAGIQLAHAGRKASYRSPWKGGSALHPGEEGAWTTVAPSAIPFQEGGITPLELDQEGIRKVITDFRTAAARALEAGFKVVEIHGAHGYLLHQFFSPLSNHRTDEYGGSFESRIRLLLEVVASVQEVWPQDYPLWVRISATDWVEDGWNENDSVQLARILKDKGVDLIDTSTGGNVPKVRIPVGPGYQVQFSEKIRKEVGIMTGAVGMITTPQEAENIVASGQADVVLLARQLLRDPYFPLRAAKQLGVDLEWPPQYQRARD
ncbi:NADPH dehydrogenase NamA [Rufibacter roseolus]|uniref:NADPH dehydrogenase NamA n=1 Tax=Rufibacter roseolus TaxID=2817375 RepID=UPI001B3176CC|nr:NADPH dehydrogenase NamA [Rufibacter roseolus]